MSPVKVKGLLVEALALTKYLHAALRERGLSTVRDLLACTDDELHTKHEVGRMSVQRIQFAMAQYDLFLREADRDYRDTSKKTKKRNTRRAAIRQPRKAVRH